MKIITEPDGGTPSGVPPARPPAEGSTRPGSRDEVAAPDDRVEAIPSGRPPARHVARAGRGWFWLGLTLLVVALGGLAAWYYLQQQRLRVGTAVSVGAAPGAVQGALRDAAPGRATTPAGGQPPAGTPAARPGGPAAGAAGGPAGGPPSTPVVAVPARAGSVPIVLDALGTVVPAQAVTVKSRVAGQLERVLFKEGDLVSEGQLLAEIDARQLRVQLAQAEGQLARDRAQLENARVDLKRYETLFRQDSIARQQVDTQAALVRQYEGLIRVNQSQVDNARLQLSFARVTAPISGRVGLRQVDAGNMVTGSEVNGLVMITQVQPISVVFTIPQDELPAVRRRLASGAALPVIAFDRTQKNRLATGQLVSFDNQIDPATGTIKLKAQFDNADGQLFPNQFVNARLELDTLRDVITIPSSAIQRGSQGLFVYVVGPNGTVAIRTVELGPADGQQIAVTRGLAAGDLVVVDGVDRLRDGARVELIQRPDFSAPVAPRPAGPRPPGGRPPGARPAGQGTSGPGAPRPPP